jgi:hypothetical protein
VFQQQNFNFPQNSSLRKLRSSNADVEAAQNVDGNDYTRLSAGDLDSRTPLHQSDYVLLRTVGILKQFFLLHKTHIVFIAILATIGYSMWRQVERGEFPVLLLMGGGFTTTAWAIYSRLR